MSRRSVGEVDGWRWSRPRAGRLIGGDARDEVGQDVGDQVVAAQLLEMSTPEPEWV